MKEFNLEEYSKMCAEFLNLHRDKEVVIYNMHSYSYNLLKFDSDWNWIMEVVEAINMIPNHKNPSDTTLQTKRIDVKILLGSANKKAVVEEINQFLIWYNQNKTKYEKQFNETYGGNK
jgi:hypothetical protein